MKEHSREILDAVETINASSDSKVVWDEFWNSWILKCPLNREFSLKPYFRRFVTEKEIVEFANVMETMHWVPVQETAVWSQVIRLIEKRKLKGEYEHEPLSIFRE